MSSDAGSCTVCNDDCLAELKCSQCHKLCHYVCGLGFNPVEEFKASNLTTEQFICAPCIVGSSYPLLHLALEAHSDAHSKSSTRSRTASNVSSKSSVTSNVSSLRHIGLSPIHSDVTQQTIRSHLQVTHDSVPAPEDPAAASVQNIRARSQTPPPRPERTLRPADNSAGTEPHPQRAPLHSNCASKSKRLSYVLRSLFNNLPDNATNVFIGDSLQKGLVKRDIDQNTDSVRIRSVGGLCVVATVHSLIQHKLTHPKIKKVVYTLGINDHLHRFNHCHEEKARYFKALEVESARVFPNATINFVIPYKGMESENITDTVQSDLQKLLRENCPNTRCLNPPNLTGKVSRGGIHPSETGTLVLTEWYSKVFVGPITRVFKRSSGRKAQGRPYSRAHLPSDTPPINSATGEIPTHHQQAKTLHPPNMSQAQHAQLSQQGPLTRGGLAGEIVTAFTQMMNMWGQQPRQPNINRYQGPQWPPVQLYNLDS